MMCAPAVATVDRPQWSLLGMSRKSLTLSNSAWTPFLPQWSLLGMSRKSRGGLTVDAGAFIRQWSLLGMSRKSRARGKRAC